MTTQLTPVNFLVIDYKCFVDTYGDILTHVAKASTEPDGRTWVIADMDIRNAARMKGDTNIVQKDISSSFSIEIDNYLTSHLI